MTAVVTVFGAILTWAHVVVLLMVLIVETGIYFPNGTRLPFAGNGGIFQNRWHKRVDLRYRSHVTSATGIYRCVIFQQILSPVMLTLQ